MPSGGTSVTTAAVAVAGGGQEGEWEPGEGGGEEGGAGEGRRDAEASLADRAGWSLASTRERGSGERRLRLRYVEGVQQRVSVLSGGRVQCVVFGLNSSEFGLKVLDALLKPSHLGEESRVRT